MPPTGTRACFICARYLPRRSRYLRNVRRAIHSTAANREVGREGSQDEGRRGQPAEGAEPGAMSRLLEDMTEQSLEEGGRSARRAVEESGFSEELKRRLEERLKDVQFRGENPGAFAELSMPVRRAGGRPS
jgi:hypothetical protein